MTTKPKTSTKTDGTAPSQTGTKSTGHHPTGAGAEAVPPNAEAHHTTEHESGYGGKAGAPRVSADKHGKS